MIRFLPVAAGLLLLAACRSTAPVASVAPSAVPVSSAETVPLPPATPDEVLRIATFNIEDVRTVDVLDADQPRLKQAAAFIQSVRPDILLVAEMTYDYAGAPDVPAGAAPGQNGQRFADTFLAVSQGPELEGLRYRAVSVETNTGMTSGFDLDRDGVAVRAYPPPQPGEEGQPGPQTPEGRRYGNDAWGFGIYPGQYAFTLLVREDFDVLEDSIRTFRYLRWSDMPGNLMPTDSAGNPWYGEAAPFVRLSSKNHADIPVRLPDGRVLHVLASHPTPPAFDGPEARNKRRNHDEIKLWADYLTGADYLVDDRGGRGGLAPGAHFVVIGDLNADPDEGNTFQNPIRLLLDHPRVEGRFRPIADAAGQARYPKLDPDDTASWGLGVDYVLPSRTLRVLRGGIIRPDPEAPPVSDHFMVWLDVAFRP